MTTAQKRTEVEEVYCHEVNRGRLGYANVLDVPLIKSEVEIVKKLRNHDAELFLRCHGVAPQEIDNVLVD
jgi:hypothetical protein